MGPAIDVPPAVVRAAIVGGIAGLVSTAALLWRGRCELERPAAPLNAPSHWVDGDKALRDSAVNLRHTATGALIHHAMSVFWAGFYELWRAKARARSPAALAAGAAGVTAVAAWVDLKVVPQRLTPGFERRLSARGLLWVYGTFALGLWLGGRLTHGGDARLPRDESLRSPASAAHDSRPGVARHGPAEFRR